MATIKISDLRSPLPASSSCEEELIGAVENAVIRTNDARQPQGIRGGLKSPIFDSIPNPCFYGYKIIDGKAVCVLLPVPSTFWA